MPQTKNEEKKIKQGDIDFKYSGNVLYCIWYDNKSIVILASIVDGVDTYFTTSLNVI